MRNVLARSAGLRNLMLTAATLAGLSIVGDLIPTPKAAAQNPNPGSAPVNIVAPLPLPVRGTVNVADSAIPVHFGDTCDIDGLSSTCSKTYSVPTGKRLVIEYASLEGNMGSLFVAGHTPALFITTTVEGTSVRHIVPPSDRASGPLLFGYAGQVVRLYADPNTLVTIGGRVPVLGPGGRIFFSFSGQLIPVP